MKERNNKIVTSENFEKAWRIINDEFPFKNYIREARKSGYFEMVSSIAKYSGLSARVLDFGAGPCDKTAAFSLLGMNVTAYDNLDDYWHKIGDNKEKILTFAQKAKIKFTFPESNNKFPFEREKFDVVMLHNVIEHFHFSPRVLLNQILENLKNHGFLAITVPNAANLRKRIHLLFGKTNYNKFEYFYWYPGIWKGHVREYVKNDLILLNKFLRLELVELKTFHLQLDVLPLYARKPFKLLSKLFPGFRDSWMMISKKPREWKPYIEPNLDDFEKAFGSQYYNYSINDFDWKN